MRRFVTVPVWVALVVSLLVAPASSAIRAPALPANAAANASATAQRVGVASYNPAAYVQGGFPIPASSAAEPSGNFRFQCEFSHLSYDDPIVYPGQPGLSHLHMFFGNTYANAVSTYESLLHTGDSTCAGGPLNRSAYWAPAMLNAAGSVVVPDQATIYYKGGFGGRASIASIPALPAGLRMIAGFDMANPSKSAPLYWYCGSKGPQETIPQYSTKIVECPAGDMVIGRLGFPACWDGRNLDSPDHRSHMSYVTYNGVSADGNCPASHPVHLPEYSLGIFWPSDGNVSRWTLSSDVMPGMSHAAGTTFHSDWFGAWDLGIQQEWTTSCINLMRNCNAGELGSGRRLSVPRNYVGPPTIPAPARL